MFTWVQYATNCVSLIIWKAFLSSVAWTRGDDDGGGGDRILAAAAAVKASAAVFFAESREEHRDAEALLQRTKHVVLGHRIRHNIQ